jgi:hypothetical protein
MPTKDLQDPFVLQMQQSNKEFIQCQTLKLFKQVYHQT